jgi:hypothetical protein
MRAFQRDIKLGDLIICVKERPTEGLEPVPSDITPKNPRARCKTILVINVREFPGNTARMLRARRLPGPAHDSWEYNRAILCDGIGPAKTYVGLEVCALINVLGIVVW